MAAPRGLNGTRMARLAVATGHHRIAAAVRVPYDLGLHVGAGEGNRTLMTSLEGCDYLVSEQVMSSSAGPPMVRE
jgi:uncharacterized protein (DUF1015 family)